MMISSIKIQIGSRGDSTSVWRHFLGLWRCDCGAAITTEVVLMAVFMVIGTFVVIASVRDSVVSEMTDTTLAVQNSQQSFIVDGAGGPSSTTAGFGYTDELDPFDGEDVDGEVLGFDFTVPPFDEYSLDTIIQPKGYAFTMTRNGSTWTGTGDFDMGRYTGSPYWPGNYTISGNTITVNFDPLGGGWNSGVMVLDGTDPDNIVGMITWINSITGFVWEATYQLVSQ